MDRIKAVRTQAALGVGTPLHSPQAAATFELVGRNPAADFNDLTMNTTTDLTQRPPRSPRVRLGGYAILPRLLDKCRALLAGKVGEYK